MNGPYHLKKQKFDLFSNILSENFGTGSGTGSDQISGARRGISNGGTSGRRTDYPLFEIAKSRYFRAFLSTGSGTGLYFYLVRFCAISCAVEIESK